MRVLPVTILPLSDPAILADLAADAVADGRRMVSRLMADWVDGGNRFDGPGERAYVALAGDGRAIAVGGLNVDPFAGDPTVGRVRRLYVAAAQRRQGVASALMSRLAV